MQQNELSNFLDAVASGNTRHEYSVATVTEVYEGNKKAKVRLAGGKTEFELLNKTGEVLEVGDGVILFSYNGKSSNAVIFIRFGETNGANGVNEQVISEINHKLTQHIIDRNNPHAIEPRHIGAAYATHSHEMNDITSGIVPITRGGTDADNASQALTNLGAARGFVGFSTGSGSVNDLIEEGSYYIKPETKDQPATITNGLCTFLEVFRPKRYSGDTYQQILQRITMCYENATPRVFVRGAKYTATSTTWYGWKEL